MNWDVQNFGASGSTLLKKGNLPYWKRPHFKNALAFKPDVAVILFGANDSKHGDAGNPKIANNWQYKADFADDYKAMLTEFRKANPNIKFLLGLPAPAFAPNRYGIDGTVIENDIVPLVREIAEQLGATTIDLHSVLMESKLFRDHVHPNDAGTRVMAATIYHALTGQAPPPTLRSLDKAESPTPAPISVPPVSTVPTSAGSLAAVPPVKENFHIYLLMGQSNMAGRGALDISAAQEDNPRILALNADNQWVKAKDPLHSKVGRMEPGVGPAMSFASEMLKDNPNISIGLIPCAVGGSALRSWVKGADYYENAVRLAKTAAATGVIKGVLWHQGEAGTNNQKSAETYEARLANMLTDLRTDLGMPNLPIVVGQLGDFLALTPEKYPYAETVRIAIKRIPTLVPDVGYADSIGLDHKGDKLHFSSEAQKEMGKCFASAMQVLQKK